jgi:hypothetical protein
MAPQAAASSPIRKKRTVLSINFERIFETSSSLLRKLYILQLSSPLKGTLGFDTGSKIRCSAENAGLPFDGLRAALNQRLPFGYW